MDTYTQDLYSSNHGASTSKLTLESRPTCIASSTAPNTSGRDSGAFYRDARICPDGSCVLASADDRSLSLIPLTSSQSSSTPTSLSPSWTHQPPDSLLSYDWYPGASIADPSMFAFAVGVKDHPVHLLDGNDRRIRASYPIIDHTERFVAPTSMRFTPDGLNLYCGFENAIEIFDVSRPGEEGFRMKTTPNRASRTGQKGLISTIDFSPSHGTSLVAAGSFTGTIGLYDTTSPTALVGMLSSTQRGGLTKVMYHPTIPHLLFAASRQSSYLEVFDLRNFALEPVRLERKGRTNQRIGFDIDPTGNWLMTGDQYGSLSFFDTSFLAYTDTSEPLAPTYTHPIATRQIVTCSGTRRFPIRSGRPGRRRTTSIGDDSTSESESEGDAGGEAGLDEEEDGKDSLQVFEFS
ncbi:hypothetical protein JCM16303_000333 [Sporobolomyces ruberrimus]